MKKYLGFFSVGLLALMLFSGCFGLTAHAQSQLDDNRNSAPEQIVRKYFMLARQNELKELNTLVTGSPAVYLEYKYKLSEWGEKQGKVKEKTEKDSSEPQGMVGITDSVDTVVTKLFPQTIREDSLYIKDVKQVWIKGDEARVRVVLGKERDETFSSTREVYLYRENNAWKIFQIFYPDK